MITNNKTLNLADVVCTDKAVQGIQTFDNDLSGRERQLIVLMTRSDDGLCSRACQHLLDKVDLHALIERGYLTLHGHSDEATYSYPSYDETADSSATISTADTSHTSPVSNDDIDPILNVVAGNF